MLDTLDNVVRIVSRVVLMIIIAIGCVMLVISLLHIFNRYVLNSSLSWSEELLKILLVWFCLLSASYIAVRREHVSIVVFKQMFPKKVEHIMDLSTQLIIFVSSLLVFIIGILMIVRSGSRVTPALGVPYAVKYAAVSVAFAVMALYELRNLLFDLFRPGTRPAVSEHLDDIPDEVQSHRGE